MSSNYEAMSRLGKQRVAGYRRQAEAHRMVKESKRGQEGRSPGRSSGFVSSLLALFKRPASKRPLDTEAARKPRPSVQ